LNTAGMGHARL